MKLRIHNNREMAGQGGRDGQAQLPFSTAPLDFSQPIECRFNQLPAVRDKAAAEGFRIFRLKVIAGGYEAQFQREAAGDAIAAMLAVTRRTFQPVAENVAKGQPDGKASPVDPVPKL